MTTFFKTLLILIWAYMTMAARLPIRASLNPVKNPHAMQFRGNIGGIGVEDTGTIQEIYARFQKRHPEIDLTLAGSPSQEWNTTVVHSRQTATTLHDNGIQGFNENGLYVFCCPVSGQTFTNADRSEVLGAITHLGDPIFTGPAATKCIVPFVPNTKSCTRVSCNGDNGAIYVCNTSGGDLSIYCPDIASHATELSTYCDAIDISELCGQIMVPAGGYNVYITNEKCM